MPVYSRFKVGDPESPLAVIRFYRELALSPVASGVFIVWVDGQTVNRSGIEQPHSTYLLTCQYK